MLTSQCQDAFDHTPSSITEVCTCSTMYVPRPPTALRPCHPPCNMQCTSASQDVLERQKSREAAGDNVNYVLARTVRCQLQYLASVNIGARGVGNQAKRGDCFKTLIDMFDGSGMDGVPRDIVLALLRH